MESSETVERRCDLPYGVEYAKSGRSTCKGCRQYISQDSLRMSVREPSAFFDGLQDNWFHTACFFNKLRPGKDKINERSIRGVESLKWADQEGVRLKIDEFEKTASNCTKSTSDDNFSFLKLEHSKTNRGKCAGCTKNFNKDELKVAKKSSWYHIDCLLPGNYKGSPTAMIGFGIITPIERQSLLDKFEQADTSKDAANNSLAGDMIAVDGNAEAAKASSNTDDADILILPVASTSHEKRENDSSAPVPGETIVKRARFKPIVLTEADKLKDKLKKQTDTMWELRDGFQNNLKKQQMIDLLIQNKQTPPSEEGKILDLLVDCALFGRPAVCPKCPTGQIVFSLSKRTYICLGYITEWSKCMYENKNPLRTPFAVPFKMIEKCPFLLTVKFNVLSERIYVDSEDPIVSRAENSFKHLGARSHKASEMYEDGNSMKPMGMGAGMSQHYIKHGTVVDMEFPQADVCHVYKDEDNVPLMTTLVSADMVSNTNSYYKIQLLKHDMRDWFYLFRSWGRVGTNVGGTKTEEFQRSDIARTAFENLFLEKTGNQWKNRQYFRKKAGLMNYIETDYSELTDVKSDTVLPGSLTTLHRSIKELMIMIFDVENMKSAMKGFELDLDRMPLGKLSKNQIMKAFTVLTELQTILECAVPDQHLILDASNRFYTIIPHNFGMHAAIPLNSTDILKQKCTMLDSLLEIQFAYSILQDNKNVVAVGGKDPVDVHYEKLKCDMEYVDPKHVDFGTVNTYLKSTHGQTHSGYNLQIVDLIRVSRQGEAHKFKANLGNRMLLWHGSGRPNFSGILSQGLRIAPPEAPSTGYMFGKGVYFADMVSKSANYCRTNTGEEGLLLLCDVALGNIQEEMNATNVKNLKKGFHSVKGVGMTGPLDTDSVHSPDGYRIPLGTPQTNKAGGNGLCLQYNEYIVYDVNQINIRYLVRTKFLPPKR